MEPRFMNIRNSENNSIKKISELDNVDIIDGMLIAHVSGPTTVYQSKELLEKYSEEYDKKNSDNN